MACSSASSVATRLAYSSADSVGSDVGVSPVSFSSHVVETSAEEKEDVGAFLFSFSV